MIHDDLIVDNLDTAFERAAATVGEAVAIYGGDCETTSQASCTYEVAGPMKLIGTGPTTDGPAESVSLIYFPNGDAAGVGMYLSLMIVAVEPDMTMAERRTIVTTLAKGAVDGMAAISGRNADYSVLDMRSEGIWFTAAAKRSD